MLKGPVTLASSRIHGYCIHSYLRSRGWNSHLLFQPLKILADLPLYCSDFQSIDLIKSNDIVIIQKLTGNRTRDALQYFASMDVHTVFVDADFPPKQEEATLAKHTICTSHQLADAYRDLGIESVTYIPDAIESSCLPKNMDETPLKCVWYGNVPLGHSERIAELEFVRGVATKAAGWTSVIISDNYFDIQWNLKTIWGEMSSCHAAVLPVSKSPRAYAKSSNRVVQGMAVGLPVLASPIPSYKEVIQDGITGFLCSNEMDWINALEKLRDKTFRRYMSHNAYNFAVNKFSLVEIGRKWEELLADIVDEGVRDKRISVNTCPETKLRRIRARSFSRMAVSRSGKRMHSFVLAVKIWPPEGIKIIWMVLGVLKNQLRRLK